MKAAAALLFPLLALAQTNPLAYRPVDAEYSSALDKIVMVAGDPNRLLVYDPVAKTTGTVPLSYAPLNVSVSPAGLHAAVGHNGVISYVNLSTGVVEKTFTLDREVREIALGSQYVYTRSRSIHLTTGAVSDNGNPGDYYGSGLRLHPSGLSLYGTRDGIGPNDLHRFEVGTGPVTKIVDSPYHGDFNICGEVWFSPDGKRVYNACGTVFNSSADPKFEMTYVTSFRGTAIQTFAESAAGRIAMVPAASTWYVGNPGDNDKEVRLYDSAYLRQTARYPLAPFSAGGKAYDAHGKWVFFNKAGTVLYAVMQADLASGLLADFAVQTIPLSGAAPCAVTLESPTASAPASGAPGSAGVLALPDCIYTASSNAPWIALAGPATGSGNGRISYSVRANAGGARSGTLSIGGQTFTISQAAAPPVPEPAQRLSYPVIDAQYSRALDKLILVSAAPDELHIRDTVTGAEQLVALSAPPMALSIRPDGLSAAVGHDGWISIVNLQTLAVEKVLSVITDMRSLVYAGNGYVYAFPVRSWSDIYSVAIATGVWTGTSAIYEGRVARLHPSGSYIYVADGWTSKWDIRGGVAALAPGNNQAVCSPLWITETGNRLVGGCGSVFRASEVPAQDFQPNGSLAGLSLVEWADHSQAAGMVAAAPGNTTTCSGCSPDAQASEIQLFRDADLGLQTRYFLPGLTIDGATYRTRGKWVFWNQAGSRLTAVTQAFSSQPLTADFAVTVLPVSASCPVTLSSSSFSPSSDAVSRNVTVTAAPSCVWTASTSAAWLGISAGSAGTGNGAVDFTIAANGDPTPRTGSITIGDKTITVNQAGVIATVTISPSTQSCGGSYCSGAFSISVSPQYAKWTATSSQSWLQLGGGSPPAGTGSGSLYFFAPQNNGAPRTTTVTVLGQSATLTQNSTVPWVTAPIEGQTVNTGGVTFSWSPVDYMFGYLLEVRSGSTTLFTGSLSGGGSTTTLITLPAGSFTFLVRPCSSYPLNAANCGTPQTRNFSVTLPAPAAAPSITAPTAGQNLTTSTNQFSWTSVAGASRYEAWLRDMAAGGATELSISAPGISTIASTKASTQYQLQIRACSDACGPWSAPMTFSVTLPPVPTVAPNQPSCNVIANRVTCSWNAVTNADLYLVQVVQPGAGPGGGALTVASRQVSGTSIVEPGPLIAPVGSAGVYVAACNGNGCGPNSTPAPVTVAGTNSASPVLGTPASGTVVTRNDVLFSWNRVPGDNGSNTVYRLYVQDMSRSAPAL